MCTSDKSVPAPTTPVSLIVPEAAQMTPVLSDSSGHARLISVQTTVQDTAKATPACLTLLVCAPMIPAHLTAPARVRLIRAYPIAPARGLGSLQPGQIRRLYLRRHLHHRQIRHLRFDLCRSDSSHDCATSDTCALDSRTGMRSRRQALASKGINRALKWLYNISTIVLVIITGAFAHAQEAPIVIDATNAMFLPAPAFTTGTNVTIAPQSAPSCVTVTAMVSLRLIRTETGSAQETPR